MGSNLQISTGVIGASGYSGGELMRLLSMHPNFNLQYFAAGSNSGEFVTSIHPQLANHYAGALFAETTLDQANQCELLFLALPHGQSAALLKELDPRVKVVDLGADFRLTSSAAWEKYYGGSHAGSLVYALPELPGARPEISNSRQVANPGCYATSIILAALPAVAGNLMADTDLVVVAASGTTGAGRSLKPNLLASEVMSSMSSYKFAGAHQHTPEIEQALGKVAGRELKLNFTPILAPMPRGILTTLSLKLSEHALGFDDAQIYQIYADHFAESEFVKLLPAGVLPNTSAVSGSNYAHMQVGVDRHAGRLVVSVAIDNLGKGAAGQAIQNANLLFGLAETTGLTAGGIRP